MKYISVMLVLCAMLTFAACSDRTEQNSDTSQTQTEEAVQEQTDAPAETEEEPLELEGSVVKHEDKQESEGETAPAEESSESNEEASKSEAVTSASAAEGDFLLLVNGSHPLPDGYEPQLAYVQGEYRVDTRILAPAKQMLADAKADGIDLLVCSAYRSVESQKRLFSNKVAEYMAAGKTEDEATVLTAALIAVPGTSEHHTGLAMDIVTPSYQNLDAGFAQTSAFVWLDKHAADYGFIMRYPADKTEITGIDYESWHYRYVGVDAAREIKAKGLCLEEYVEELA